MGRYSRIEDAENQLHVINSPHFYEPYRDEGTPSAPPSYQYQPNGGKRTIFYQAIPFDYYFNRNRYTESLDFPINMVLFVLGFVFPGFWCISWAWGSQNSPYERWWRKCNIVMAWIIIITILVLAFLNFVVRSNIEMPDQKNSP